MPPVARPVVLTPGQPHPGRVYPTRVGTVDSLPWTWGGTEAAVETITLAEAATHLGISTKTLYRMVPSYWRFDARIGYRFDQHWELSANIQNITDEAYFNQVYTSHYASIAPGRSAFATLSFKY